MKEKIITKAAEMFLSLGFKSVTMDDISNEMGISKKTIYTHFNNKTQLVKESVLKVFEEISCGIDAIQDLEKDPIEELYDRNLPSYAEALVAIPTISSRY